MAENKTVPAFWEHHVMRLMLKGTTPFLQNNPSVMTPTKTGIQSGKKDYDPAKCAEAATYRRKDGTLGFPACALRKCLITAGTGIYVGRRTLGTLLPEWLGYTPNPMGDDDWPLEGDELFPFEDKEGRLISKYVIDTRRAIRGNQGVQVSRPKIWPWYMRCRLQLTLPVGTDIEDLTPGFLQVANKAGQYPGLGDGRPERIKGKGLWFGKFEVIEFSIEPLTD